MGRFRLFIILSIFAEAGRAGDTDNLAYSSVFRLYHFVTDRSTNSGYRVISSTGGRATDSMMELGPFSPEIGMAGLDSTEDLYFSEIGMHSKSRTKFLERFFHELNSHLDREGYMKY